jgi:hypothetical protein
MAHHRSALLLLPLGLVLFCACSASDRSTSPAAVPNQSAEAPPADTYVSTAPVPAICASPEGSDVLECPIDAQPLAWWVDQANRQSETVVNVRLLKSIEVNKPYDLYPGVTIPYVSVQADFEVQEVLWGAHASVGTFSTSFLKPGCYKYQFADSYKGPRKAEPDCSHEYENVPLVVGADQVWILTSSFPSSPEMVFPVGADGTLSGIVGADGATVTLKEMRAAFATAGQPKAVD